MRFPSLSQEDAPEEGMATHSSILSWRIPWMEKPEGYSPWGRKDSDMTEGLNPRLLHLLPWQADSLPLRHLGGHCFVCVCVC